MSRTYVKHLPVPIDALAENYLRNCEPNRMLLYLFADSIDMTLWSTSYWLGLEKITFHALVDAERKRRCDELLESNTKLKASTICTHVGYVETKSAYHAIKRWYGCGIKELRSRA